MTPHELLANDSDVPRRLADARKHGGYDFAMTRPPEPVSPAVIVIATIGLGSATVFPFICLGVTPSPPVWLFFVLAGLALIPALLLRATWRRYRTMCEGEVRRELCAIIGIERERFHNNRRFYLTMWNPEMSFKRSELVIGEPAIGIGDVGVAVYRGDLLINVIKIPVAWQPSA